MLRVCGISEADLHQWQAAVERARATSNGRLLRPVAPYPGLTSFDVADAATFYGRAVETAQIMNRIEDFLGQSEPNGGMVAVIGPSGSGKTSLLRAGVAARLRTRPDRRCVVVTPGSDPRAALATARDELGTGPGVLILDQFEEVFTAVPDADARSSFLDDLARLGREIVVVLGMRADFYSVAAAEPLLVPVLQDEQLLLGPLKADDLREAITAPAATAGVAFADGLVDVVLADLTPRSAVEESHDAGALPLLSHALRTTWELGSGSDLVLADYRAAGGIDGAIQHTAEEAYAAVGAERHGEVRSLFLRLVTIDDIANVAVTRRRIAGAELEALRDADTTRVVEEFVDRRLLTAGDNSLDISHEALISAWPRLREWIGEDRLGLKLHRQVTDSANAWQQSGRDDALLLRGGRLAAAAELVDQPTPRTALNRLEFDFVAAGIAARDAEMDRSRRSTRRLQRLLAAVVVLFLAAAGLAAYALRAQSDASAAENDAAGARDLAVSRQIAAQAEQLRQSDPALAQQLALVAYRDARSDLARSALVDQSNRPTITRVLGVQGPTPLAVTGGRSPLIAVGHADDGSVHLFRMTDGIPRTTGVLPAAEVAPNQVFALQFSPNRRLLAVSGQTRVVDLWNVADPRRPRAVATLRTGFTGDVQAVDFSPASDLLVATAIGRHAVLAWDVRTPSEPREIDVPTLTSPETVVNSARFSPDGTRLVAGATGGAVLSWRVGGEALGQPRRVAIGTSSVNTVAWSPDGGTVLTGTRAGKVQPLAATDLHPQHAPVVVSSGIVNGIATAPNGDRFVVGTSDTAVSQWSTSTWQQLSTQGNPGPVTGVAYADDGRTVMSTAADGTLRVYAATPGISVDSSAFNLAVSQDSSLLGVATGGDHAGVRLWDIHDRARPSAFGQIITTPAAAGEAAATIALTRNGKLLAVGTRTGNVVIYDVSEPARPRMSGRPIPVARDRAAVETAAFSPDGQLLATGSDDNSVRLVDVRDPQHPRALATMSTGGFVFNVAFGPDGRLLAAASADEHGYVWDVRRPDHPRRTATLGGFASYAYSVAISPDGRLLAVGSADHTTRLWRLDRSGRVTALGRPLIGPSGYVFGLAFNSDGTELASASDDNTVRVYDMHAAIPSRVPQLTLDADSNSMFAVLYSPDGHTLYGAGRGSSLANWTTDVGSYATALCRRAGTPITRDEWAINVPGARYDPPCR